jgi:hypothetical protein
MTTLMELEIKLLKEFCDSPTFGKYKKLSHITRNILIQNVKKSRKLKNNNELWRIISFEHELKRQEEQHKLLSLIDIPSVLIGTVEDYLLIFMI